MSLFSELKRRNVFRMAVLYIVASWLLLQIADVLFEPLGVPLWGFRLLLALLLLGFPLALTFSWIFDLTPEGLKRTQDTVPHDSITSQTGHRMDRVIVVLLVLAIAGLALDRLIPEQPEPAGPAAAAEPVAPAEATKPTADSGPPPSENSIAVLPFVNMSGDPENEYFSDGLAEELLNTLVRIGGLKVAGRTSSFAFKGENRDLREIGKMLDVANVLEGSVRKAGNQVRITAQLVKTADGFHLWSDTFDRELDDIFAIQQEIAEQVTKALKATLLGDPVQKNAEAIVTPHDPKAYEEYLRGRYIFQRDPDGLKSLNRARAHFEKAVAIDPDYVDAYWGIFQVWDRMNRNGHGPFEQSLERMQFYSDKLEHLAPESDRTLSALGRLATVNFEYQKAANYLGEAAARYPASVSVLGEYASVLTIMKDYTGAVQVINRAARLDPLSLDIMRWKSHVLYRKGDCEGVREVMQRAMEIEPKVGRFRYYLAMCIFETTGDVERALSYAKDEPLGFAHHTALAIFYRDLDQPGKARHHLEQMFELYDEAASYQYGQVYAQWGEIDKALEWLEKAVEIRDPGIIQAGGDRLLRPLQEEPRFRQILHQAGHR